MRQRITRASAEFVDRVAAKVQLFAAVKAAVVRLLDCQIEVALSLSPGQPGSSERDDRQHCGRRDHEIPVHDFSENSHGRAGEQESYLANL